MNVEKTDTVKIDDPQDAYHFLLSLVQDRNKSYISINDVKIDKNVLKILERIIAQDPEYSVYYAEYVLLERWPQNEIGKIAEMAIASDPAWATIYAKDVLKGRWPKDEEIAKIAEEAISKSAHSVFYYADDYKN